MAVDATMRKLKVPPKFLPYLERHRIYDLFYELGNLLGLNRPDDHVLFLRNTLTHMNETRNKPRLLLILPPFMDRKKIADMIAARTGQVVLPRCDLLRNLEFSNEKEKAELVHAFIMENDILNKGWIFFDYPRDMEEAKHLLRTGTVPTHTFLFIPLSKTKTAKELWIDNLDQWTTSDIKETWNTYQRIVRDFRYIFRETFLEVNILCKSLEKMLDETTKLLKEFPVRGPPVTPRVLLIGTRGSRRGQLATKLYEKMNLVPVDMHELIEEAKIGDNEMSEQIQFLEMRKVPLYASIILKLLQERLMREDCLGQGWVLIRFPRDKTDLQALDSFDTPPNRIIFLVMNAEEAFQKLREIRIHKYTGTFDTRHEIEQRAIFNQRDNYFIHPTDNEKRILLEHENYSSAYQDMVNYCNEDCAIVNASGSLDEVLERIESAIGRPTGTGEPRLGHLKNNIPCTEDTWDLNQGQTEQQHHTSAVTSSPYLFQSSLPHKKINKFCSNT